jgi:hypothetical protein
MVILSLAEISFVMFLSCNASVEAWMPGVVQDMDMDAIGYYIGNNYPYPSIATQE